MTKRSFPRSPRARNSRYRDPRPLPFDVEGERALQARWLELERNRDWWDTYCFGAKIGFGYCEVVPEHADAEGNRQDFERWPEDRKQAWRSGFSRGFHDRFYDRYVEREDGSQ